MEEAKYWTGYWRQTGASGSCLPGAPQKVRECLSAQWREFASMLPSESSVLDLATGTGAVLRVLDDARGSALKLAGVDYADLPGSDRRSIRLYGMTKVERLPFEDETFGALTSQFGFEYCDLQLATKEIGRVAAQDAKLRFILHHRESPVFAQGRRRLDALLAVQSSALIDAMRHGVADSAAMRKFGEAARALIAQFPDQSVVREIPAALQASADSSDEIGTIQSGLEREIYTLGLLMKVARDRHGIETVVEILRMRFDCAKPVAIFPPDSERPIAWLIDGQRKSTAFTPRHGS